MLRDSSAQEQISDLKIAVNGIASMNANIIYQNTLANTGDGATKWFDHVAQFPTKPYSNMYAILYLVNNVNDDVPYYARININYSNNTYREVARFIEVNVPVEIAIDSTKTPVDFTVIGNRSDGSSSSSARVKSEWGILIYSIDETEENAKLTNYVRSYPSFNYDIIFDETLTQYGNGVTNWFNHIYDAPENLDTRYIYGIVCNTKNIKPESIYLARIYAYYTDGTSNESARITNINEPIKLTFTEGKILSYFSIVGSRSDGTTGYTSYVESEWHVIIVDRSNEFIPFERANDISASVSHSQIIFDKPELIATSSQQTQWLNNFISSSVTKFSIKIRSVTGRRGTPAHLAYVRVAYTDSTIATLGYIDNLDEIYTFEANDTKTIQTWSLVLYIADTSVLTTSTWDIFAWQEEETPEEAKEHLPIALSANLFINPSVANLPGTFYGPVEKDYVAVTTSENWQRQSYVKIDNILVNNNKHLYVIITSRHGLGLRAGAIFYYDSLAEDAQYKTFSQIEIENYDNGPCIQHYYIPDGTLRIDVEFEGISNATPAGTPSVIGETYFVRGCYAYISVDPIDESGVSTLTDEWETAIDTIREQQGTGLCFGIQTDTHFSMSSPDYVGKQLNEITKSVGFDFIANLGDITRGYSGDNYPDSPENMRKYAKIIMKRYTEGVQCPFFVAIGNHEMNGMWSSAHPDVPRFTLAELYAQYTKQSINTSAKIVAQPSKSYFYVDLVPARIIILFTNDSSQGSFTVSDEQVAWFTNEALNTNKPVVVMCHVPLIDGWSVSTNYSAKYADIITPLEAFKNNGGIVIACIYGHAHRQEAQKKNGIWHIICTRTEAQNNTAEFFMVDPNTYNITTVGVGAAQSRTFEH